MRDHFNSDSTGHSAHSPRPYKPISLGQLKELELEPLTELLGKVISEKSIGMIAGPRGSGKSLLATTLAYAIAGKKSFAPWGKGSGDAVCYLDGEMRMHGLKERLLALHAKNTKAKSIADVERNFLIVSRDHYGDPIGSIDTEEGQGKLEALIPASVALIVIDNLSAWTSGGREDGASWASIKSWLIKLRLQGKAVLLIHHTGKNGQQRGSSAHEDLLDYSILLRPATDHSDLTKTRFVVQHTKLRDHMPELKQEFEFAFWSEGDMLTFSSSPIGEIIGERDKEILRLHNQGKGKSQAEIATELGINKSTVSRVLKKFAQQTMQGELSSDEGEEGSGGKAN